MSRDAMRRDGVPPRRLLALLLSGLGASAFAADGTVSGPAPSATAQLTKMNATVSTEVSPFWSEAKDLTSTGVKYTRLASEAAAITGTTELAAAGVVATATIPCALTTGGACFVPGASLATGLEASGLVDLKAAGILKFTAEGPGAVAEAAVGMLGNRGVQARHAQAGLNDGMRGDWKDAGLDPAECLQGRPDPQTCYDALSPGTLAQAEKAQALVDRATLGADSTAWWAPDAEDTIYLGQQAAGELIKREFANFGETYIAAQGVGEKAAQQVIGAINAVLSPDKPVENMVEGATTQMRESADEPSKPVLQVRPHSATAKPTPSANAAGAATPAGAANRRAVVDRSSDCKLLADPQASRALMQRDISGWQALNERCGNN